MVSLTRAEKRADGCIAMRLFTPYSSVNLHSASSVRLPPSLAREGFCKSRFLAIDISAAVILLKPSPVEKVDRPSLYAKVETDEVKINKI